MSSRVAAPLPPSASAIGVTFDNEFDSFVSSPNGNSGWMTAYPYEGEAACALPAPLSANKEAQFYSDSSVEINPFSVHDGVLHISAAPSTGYVPYALHYTSGIITTLVDAERFAWDVQDVPTMPLTPGHDGVRLPSRSITFDTPRSIILFVSYLWSPGQVQVDIRQFRKSR